MEYNIFGVFPKPVGIFRLDKAVTAAERKFILDQPRTQNEYNTTSVENYLLKNKKLSRLKTFFDECVQTFLETIYAPAQDVSLRITQCWANYSEKGQAHHPHAHPNSLVSGVFYVQTDKATDKIYFIRSGYEQIQLPPKLYNQWNSESWWFEAEENTLILFPSGLSHRVDPVVVDQTRVSLSFNTFPIGILGEKRSLTECIL